MSDTYTDPQEEIFDVVNEQDEIIGQTTRREAHHNKSLIHRGITVLVFRGNQLYLQKRSLTKDMYPGYWTSSCTGHVNSGQTYLQAAERELKEELGLTVKQPLQFLFKHLSRVANETEFISVFRSETTDPIGINQEEISEGRFFTIDRNFFEKIYPTMQFVPDFREWILPYLEAHTNQ